MFSACLLLVVLSASSVAPSGICVDTHDAQFCAQPESAPPVRQLSDAKAIKVVKPRSNSNPVSSGGSFSDSAQTRSVYRVEQDIVPLELGFSSASFNLLSKPGDEIELNLPGFGLLQLTFLSHTHSHGTERYRFKHENWIVTASRRGHQFFLTLPTRIGSFAVHGDNQGSVAFPHQALNMRQLRSDYQHVP